MLYKRGHNFSLRSQFKLVLCNPASCLQLFIL